jgi:SNF2 family DNA or RNA helicase
MAEEQALSRIHRMGQKRAVKTVRYIIRDSIEEVMHVLVTNGGRLIDAERSRTTEAQITTRCIDDVW